MSDSYFWPLIIVLIVSAIAAVTAKRQAAAGPVYLCGSVNVPERAGSCERTRIRHAGKTYKVRVCL